MKSVNVCRVHTRSQGIMALENRSPGRLQAGQTVLILTKDPKKTLFHNQERAEIEFSDGQSNPCKSK